MADMWVIPALSGDGTTGDHCHRGHPRQHRPGSRRGGTRGELRAHGRTRPDHTVRADADGEAGVLHAAGAAHPEHVDPYTPHPETSTDLAARASASRLAGGTEVRPDELLAVAPTGNSAVRSVDRVHRRPDSVRPEQPIPRVSESRQDVTPFVQLTVEGC